jgi:hypothetical protein
MAGRYADLSTEELDRLIDLEERRMGRERAGTRRRQRCAPLPATGAALAAAREALGASLTDATRRALAQAAAGAGDVEIGARAPRWRESPRPLAAPKNISQPTALA